MGAVDIGIGHDDDAIIPQRVGVAVLAAAAADLLSGSVRALPATVKTIAVMDRCKESGAIGDPLHLDVVTALREARNLGLI